VLEHVDLDMYPGERYRHLMYAIMSKLSTDAIMKEICMLTTKVYIFYLVQVRPSIFGSQALNSKG